MAALLIDLTHVCDEHTDSALEALHKAIGEDPPGDDIWSPHPNPYVRRLVELFTERGLERIAGLEAELRRILNATVPPTGERLPRPEGAMRRWTQPELALARLYLERLPRGEFSLDDWMLLIDYVFQRYLNPDDVRTEAEWLATRSAMMGRVSAAMAREPSERQTDTILAALPDSVKAAGEAWTMTPAQAATIEYGRARCAEYVTALSESARHRMRRLIVDWQEASFLGDGAARQTLDSRLLDEFGQLNRDWRRIAVTEATENVDQGFIAAMPAGAKVRRVEKYRGACPFCRSIHGTVLTVVDASAADKDGDKQVWVGKNNIGRSAAPRRRQDGKLVEREPHEKWWIAAGAIHPHCRGAWVTVGGAAADPVFDAWLEDLRMRRGRYAPAAVQ